MFKNEKVYLVENRERSILLEDEQGRPVALLFLTKDGLIIRSDLVCKDTQISPPQIKSI